MAGVNRPAELDRVFDGLRPHPHRGDIVAAGAVVVAVGVGMVNVRMDGLWGDGVFLVLNLLAFALIFTMGMLADLEDGRPRPYQSALLVAGLALLALTLFRLAEVFGVDNPLGASGAVFWMGFILAGVAAWPAWARNSAICALIEVVVGGIALLAFVDLVFSPDSPTTFRWLLLLLLAVYALASLWRRDRERRHAVMMINAAGLAILALELTFLGNIIPSVFAPAQTIGFGVGFGWALIMLAGGFGLVAYSAIDREPGPGYLGVLVLAVAVLIVGFTGDHNLLFWPLFLLLVGIAGVALGLRPRRRLPPEPSSGTTAETTPIRPEGGGLFADPSPTPAPTRPAEQPTIVRDPPEPAEPADDKPFPPPD